MPESPDNPQYGLQVKSLGRSLGSAAVAALAIVTRNLALGLLSLLAPASFLRLVGETRCRGERKRAGVRGLWLMSPGLARAVAPPGAAASPARGVEDIAGVMLLAALANGFDLGHALLTQRWVQVREHSSDNGSCSLSSRALALQVPGEPGR